MQIGTCLCFYMPGDTLQYKVARAKKAKMDLVNRLVEWDHIQGCLVHMSNAIELSNTWQRRRCHHLFVYPRLLGGGGTLMPRCEMIFWSIIRW